MQTYHLCVSMSKKYSLSGLGGDSSDLAPPEGVWFYYYFLGRAKLQFFSCRREVYLFFLDYSSEPDLYF
jgi:hypothetical protein